MAAKPLTKAYQFTWEALKFTGKNWKIALLMVVLPVMLPVFMRFFPLVMYFDYEKVLYQLLLPFWILGWLRFLLLQQKPTLKSYFTLTGYTIAALYYKEFLKTKG